MSENVFVGVFDTDILRFIYPEWDALNRDERYQLLQNHVPDREIEESNVTCTELHKWLAQVINPEININDEVSELYLGDGGTTTDSNNTSLNNKVAEIDVSDASYDELDEETLFSVFVDSTEANDTTLNELALVSENGRFLNHAPIEPDVTKTNSKTLIVEVVLGFS